jgi:hypothetical protein
VRGESGGPSEDSGGHVLWDTRHSAGVEKGKSDHHTLVFALDDWKLERLHVICDWRGVSALRPLAANG